MRQSTWDNLRQPFALCLACVLNLKCTNCYAWHENVHLMLAFKTEAWKCAGNMIDMRTKRSWRRLNCCIQVMRFWCEWTKTRVRIHVLSVAIGAINGRACELCKSGRGRRNERVLKQEMQIWHDIRRHDGKEPTHTNIAHRNKTRERRWANFHAISGCFSTIDLPLVVMYIFLDFLIFSLHIGMRAWTPF